MITAQKTFYAFDLTLKVTNAAPTEDAVFTQTVEEHLHILELD